MGLVSVFVFLGSNGPWVDQATAQEKLLHEGTISGGRVTVVVELAPVDRLNPGVLNGVLNTADSDGNGIPDHVQNADLHLEAQIRYARGTPNIGARAAQEFVPFLRVTAFITDTTTAVTIAVRLLPHVGVAEGWHYASNVQFQGDPLNDVYSIAIRIDPPTGLAKHSDFAGVGEVGTLYVSRTDITLSGITTIDIENPDGISGPTTVTVTENLPAGS
jgi:uncharacterized protein involved in high-affinity Fe2+ transport